MSTPVYFSWISVPDHLVLESQLAKFDLPRTVAGPVRGWIRTWNAYGKKDEFALYDMHESAPTTGTAAALEAAATRRMRVYRCEDCGAHTEAELGLNHPCRRTDVEHASPCPWMGRRCAMCRRVALLAAAARAAADDRVRTARWATRMLEADAVVVRVATVYPTPATSAGGRRRPAAGWVIDAADAHGAPVPVPSIARASRKASGLGADVVDAEDGAARLHAAFGGRTIITYTLAEEQLLTTLLAAHRPGNSATTPEFITDFRHQLTVWRGLIAPDTGRWMEPLDPGPADRCALLLRRMAQTDPDGTSTPEEDA